MPSLDDLHMDVIAHSRELSRYARRRLDTLQGDINALLARVDLTAISRQRLGRLVQRINRLVEEAYEDITQHAQENVSAVLPILVAGIAMIVADLGIPEDVPDDERRQKARRQTRQLVPETSDVTVEGETIREVFQDSAANVKQALRRRVRFAAVSDQPQADIGGAIDKAKKSVSAKAEGVMTSAEVESKQSVGEAVKAQILTSDIVGFIFDAKFDSKTCFICASYAGTFFDLSLTPEVPGVSPPSVHLHCRCSLDVAYADDVADTPEGRVAKRPSFTDFMERKSQEWLRKYFGPNRYELWKEGKITLNELVANGDILTLDELESKY